MLIKALQIDAHVRFESPRTAARIYRLPPERLSTAFPQNESGRGAPPFLDVVPETARKRREKEIERIIQKKAVRHFYDRGFARDALLALNMGPISAQRQSMKLTQR